MESHSAAIIGVDISVVVCVLTSNLFIIVSIVLYRKQELLKIPHCSKSSTLLVINLSAADFLVALTYIFLILSWYLAAITEYLQHHFVPCVLRSALPNAGHFTSGFTILVIAIDRYVAVFHVLRYREIMSTRHTFLAIGMTWVSAILLASTLFYWHHWTEELPCVAVNFHPQNYDLTIYTLYHTVIIVSVVAVYWSIHRKVAKLQRRRQSDRVGSRSARTLATILVVYVTSWTPHMVVVYLEFTGVSVPALVNQLTNAWINVTYLANPFIYAYNTRLVKRCLNRSLARFQSKAYPQMRIYVIKQTLNAFPRKFSTFKITESPEPNRNHN